jgi:RNA polymerase sigma-70 factor (ECF subfamily)
VSDGPQGNPVEITELIEQACEGSEAACSALYQAYVGPVYRLAYGVLLDERDTEEVVQDSFVYALRNLRRYDASRSAFRTWLFMITMSRCRNKRRRRWLPTVGLSERAEQIAAKAGRPPERATTRQSLRETIHQALAQLSPKLREAVVLRYFDRLTYREMGEVLGCPQKTAESRVRLAHEALRELLADDQQALVDGLWAYD